MIATEKQKTWWDKPGADNVKVAFNPPCPLAHKVYPFIRGYPFSHFLKSDRPASGKNTMRTIRHVLTWTFHVWREICGQKIIPRHKSWGGLWLFPLNQAERTVPWLTMLGIIFNPHHEPGRVLLCFVRFSKNISIRPRLRLIIKHFLSQNRKYI